MSRQPLTWRNINAPNYGSSNALLKDATDGINTSLGNAADNLTSLISRDVNQQKANWDQTKADNTLGLQNRINSFNDLAGYDALQQSIMGELAGMGKQVDSANIINLLNGRDDTLRANINAEQTFADGQLTRQEAPQIAKINAAINAGKFDEARNLMNTANIRDMSALEQSLKTAVTTADVKSEQNLLADFPKYLAENGITTEEEAIKAAYDFISGNKIDQGTNAKDLVNMARNTWVNATKQTAQQQRDIAEQELLLEAQINDLESAHTQKYANMIDVDPEYKALLLGENPNLDQSSVVSEITDKIEKNTNWLFQAVNIDNEGSTAGEILTNLEKEIKRGPGPEPVRGDKAAWKQKKEDFDNLNSLMSDMGGKIPGIILQRAWQRADHGDGDFNEDNLRRLLIDEIRHFGVMREMAKDQQKSRAELDDKIAKMRSDTKNVTENKSPENAAITNLLAIAKSKK